MESKKRRVYAIIAGVCFIVAGVLEGIQTAIDVKHTIKYIHSDKYLHSGSDFFYQTSGFLGFFVAIISIVFGIVWLLKKKRLAFWIVGWVYCAVCAVDAIVAMRLPLLSIRYSTGYSTELYMRELAGVISPIGKIIVSLLFLSILVLPRIGIGQKPIVSLKTRFRHIYYITPALLSFLTVGAYILFRGNLRSFRYWLYYPTSAIIGYLFVTAALLMGCLWLKDCDTRIFNTPIFQKKAPIPAPAAPLIGRAERLQQYKDLLDAGVLTQAEFDAKKAEILHL